MAQSYAPQSVRSNLRAGWADALIFVALFGLFFGVSHLTREMNASFSPAHQLRIDLSLSALPGYAARSLLRMFIAFGASLLFTFVYGYIAAYNPAARKVMLPLLDILQSVPVLGFLSITVTGFMALFPGSLMGLECASIFAIFTGQAWNMTFSFYQSLISIPRDLREAATIYQLTWRQRLIKLEIPYSMIGLVWNGMMSFGGGWFFLAASEAITVLNHSYYLPGIGSYMATAAVRGDTKATIWAILAMIVIVLLVDQLFWRPVVAWSQKFKFEQTDAVDEPTSIVLDILRHSQTLEWLSVHAGAPLSRWIDRAMATATRIAQSSPPAENARRIAGWVLSAAVAIVILYGVYRGFSTAMHSREITLYEVAKVFGYALLTFLRVVVMLVFATLVWTPIGVAIGFSPRMARIAQPLVQIGASFPANLLFPIVVIGFIDLHIDLNWGSIILIALGTQWYILFNVIAGASAVPSDLREAAAIFGLRGVNLWRRLILPAVFPAWVTGALTAAGGAWNASIVAEVVTSGSHHLAAAGIGRYITDATTRGDWPQIILGIGVMSIYVVVLNKYVWRPLYTLAEERYGLS